jgi:hypothetical protein
MMTDPARCIPIIRFTFPCVINTAFLQSLLRSLLMHSEYRLEGSE